MAGNPTDLNCGVLQLRLFKLLHHCFQGRNDAPAWIGRTQSRSIVDPLHDFRGVSEPTQKEAGHLCCSAELQCFSVLPAAASSAYGIRIPEIAALTGFLRDTRLKSAGAKRLAAFRADALSAVAASRAPKRTSCMVLAGSCFSPVALRAWPRTLKIDFWRHSEAGRYYCLNRSFSFRR